jgi:hypothetical protein
MSEQMSPKSSETSIPTIKYEILDILNRHGSAFEPRNILSYETLT